MSGRKIKVIIFDETGQSPVDSFETTLPNPKESIDAFLKTVIDIFHKTVQKILKVPVKLDPEIYNAIKIMDEDDSGETKAEEHGQSYQDKIAEAIKVQELPTLPVKEQVHQEAVKAAGVTSSSDEAEQALPLLRAQNADAAEWTEPAPEEGETEMRPRKKTKAYVQIIVRQRALQAAEQHASEDVTRETGGVLLGKLLDSENGQPTAVITGTVRALRAVRKSASVNFTPETWAEIWRDIDLDCDYQDDTMWQVVGWYHTHPGFGIFLSGMDLAIHHGHFTRPGHLALVIDPHSGKHGFFGWDPPQEQVARCSEAQVHRVNDAQLVRWLNERNLGNFSEQSLPTAQIERSISATPPVPVSAEVAPDSPAPVEPEISPAQAGDETS